jgi:hypothetical protein
MRRFWQQTSCALACAAALVGTGCGDESGSGVEPLACEQAVSASLQDCVADVSAAIRLCYEASGALCDDDAESVAAALDTAAVAVATGCSDDATVRAAEYGEVMTLDGLGERVGEHCRAEATSLAVRTFGGPQGAAWGRATAEDRQCLGRVHDIGVGLLGQLTGSYSDCVLSAGLCDAASVVAAAAALEDTAVADVTTACGATQAQFGIDAATFVSRTAAQADCLTAAGHPDPAPLELRCGPEPEATPLPRGEYVQVVLDEDIWGTRCGDGSPYAFQVSLAPEGEPVENVIVAMQGGGVCIFEQDCRGVAADLFEAASDRAPTDGILSNDPAVSPFAKWTKVFLPYCTQDVFIGGGRTSEFASVTVHRYGAVNTRQALRRVRDILWDELDRTRAAGYHPRQVRAFFGGFSAGAFGTLYNYHWVLDDLSWPRTTAFPDAGLALDNGQQLGIRALGNLLLSEPPLGWGARPFTPSYCFRGECAVGPTVLASAAPRLGRLPEQQFMVLTNQVDQTQVDTTFFSSTTQWVNAMRASYCATKDLPGVSYFMPADARSIHVISPDTSLFVDRAVAGVTMREWFAAAIADPGSVDDRVEEGSLTTERPGVLPFACEVAP